MTGALMGAAGAGISAATGIGSSIASNVSNKNIQQMNNEFNERMLQKQMDYNTQMYQQQLSDSLKYSDPQFLRNRLEGAGYNAGVLAASGNLGQVVSAPQAQGVTPPQASHRVADFSGIGDAIGGALDLYNRTKLNDAQATNMRIEGKFLAQKAIAEINKTMAETKNKEALTATEDVLRGVRRDMMAMETNLNKEQAQKIAIERRGVIIDNMMKSKQLEFLPQQIKMTLANGAADIALKKVQQRLTSKQVEHEAQKLAETVARAANVEQSTQNLKTQNMIQGQQYRYDSVTFKNRVRLLREQILSTIGHNKLPMTLDNFFIHQHYKDFEGID